MHYKSLPYVNKKVSKLIYGTAGAPFDNGGDADELLDQVYNLGINFFDTARQYGHSEAVLGNWMEKRGNRDKIAIITKGAHPDENKRRVSKEEIKVDLETSLHYLKTNYVDVYLLHRDDPTVPVAEIAEIMNELHAQGKIGAFGGSNWTAKRIDELNEYAYKNSLIPFTISSPNFGLAEQVSDPFGGGCISISGKDGAKEREFYQKHALSIVAYSPLGRGLFSGKVKSDDPDTVAGAMDIYAQKGYLSRENFERLRRCEVIAKEKGVSVPQVALSWFYAQQLKAYAVVHSSSAVRMKDNCAALDLQFSKDEYAWINLEWDYKEITGES